MSTSPSQQTLFDLLQHQDLLLDKEDNSTSTSSPRSGIEIEEDLESSFATTTPQQIRCYNIIFNATVVVSEYQQYYYTHQNPTVRGSASF